eukprot:m.50813 g.50813  ORF g.50813 m.50813 type:complete len:82 (-) comp21351_c0_seq1:752-997(-)
MQTETHTSTPTHKHTHIKQAEIKDTRKMTILINNQSTTAVKGESSPKELLAKNCWLCERRTRRSLWLQCATSQATRRRFQP